MAIIGEITHTTTYRYAKPVRFGTHRAMFLPRRGASTRLLRWSAATSLPSKVHWVTDSRSNAVTVMDFSEPGSELTFTFRVRGVYFGIKGLETFPLDLRPRRSPCSTPRTNGPTLPVTCARMPTMQTAAMRRGPRASLPAIRIGPPTCCAECSASFAATSAIAAEMPKAHSHPAKRCARNRAPAGTSPG